MSDIRFDDIGACVFDAYGTLFDVNAAAREEAAALGDDWQRLAETWRSRQLQYTWLRSLAGRHADFWQVTGDALDFALAEIGKSDSALRERLMALYLRLDCYPDVPATLARIKAAGIRTAILSNGSPDMLASAVANAGIGDSLDAVLSVEEVGIFKPHPRVYQLAVDRLGVGAGRISFQSSNGWDAYNAKAFGMRVVWCNRFGQPAERIPESPDAEVTSLAALPAILGIA
ncbi:haloacid dehalogenase type II [Oceanibacterium hippocampi]|uniref:(S)-2-haloacid dehalogenase n=1 Tax=Oceanibacterium hippocampi TaxID=745714 RepID=A0A1Y5U213_9PROT|nr:haloacid dehalogenase type II [Oceanibacterium hippocampi]SLN77104.1 (S)-2-haloacid dehalogenase 4A [Oceanibacterium hippocampi]